MINLLVASHMTDTDDQLKVRIDYRYEKMNNNAIYSMFQTQITQMGELLAAFKTASNNAKDIGGPNMTKAKNKAKDELKQFVRLFNTEIEVAANKLASDEAARTFAEGTGVDIKEAKSTNKKSLSYLEIPPNFDVINDNQRKGGCIATWDRIKGGLTYITEEVDDEGRIKNIYSCTKPPLLIQCNESNVKKNYRMKVSGADTLVSDYTEVVSVWVR